MRLHQRPEKTAFLIPSRRWPFANGEYYCSVGAPLLDSKVRFQQYAPSLLQGPHYYCLHGPLPNLQRIQTHSQFCSANVAGLFSPFAVVLATVWERINLFVYNPGCRHWRYCAPEFSVFSPPNPEILSSAPCFLEITKQRTPFPKGLFIYIG